MSNPFILDRADDYRVLHHKIAPMVYRSDLFVRLGREITQFTRLHIQVLGHTVRLWSKVAQHGL